MVKMLKRSWRLYDFSSRCESCENDALPAQKITGLCDPCCFGEAESYWEWIQVPDWKTAPNSVLIKASRLMNRNIIDLTLSGIEVSDEISEAFGEFFSILEERHRKSSGKSRKLFDENKKYLRKQWGKNYHLVEEAAVKNV